MLGVSEPLVEAGLGLHAPFCLVGQRGEEVYARDALHLVDGVDIVAFRAVDYKSNVTPTDCSSTTELYTFHPVMENTYIAAKHGYYLKSEQNSFVYNIHPEAYIQPLRYYMTIQDRGDMSYIVPANGGASKAKICVIGENEPTGITDLVDEAASASGKIYNLQGVVVGNTTEGLPKGVYIKNGRKIIVK